MMAVVYVAAGGALGAMARFACIRLLDGSVYATIAVNTAGCFLAGLATVLIKSSSGQQMLIIGLLGSFTTFSTFAADTMLRLHGADTAQVALYLIANIVGGCLLVVAGMMLGRALV